MKKLFGRDKPKMAKVTPVSREPTTQVLPREASEIEPEHPHQGHRPTFQPQPQPPKRSGSLGMLDQHVDRGHGSGDERWELIRGGGAESPMLVPTPPGNEPVPRATPPALAGSHSHSSLGSLPPGVAPALTLPARPESPYSTSSQQGVRKTPSSNGPVTLKKKSPAQAPPPAPGSAVAALGILNSLNPHHSHSPPQSSPPYNWDERSEVSVREGREEQRKERWGFFTRDRSKERDKGKRIEDDPQAEITRMIGYLVATASEDWSLVLELCERVSGNENNAKEAAKALKREFKYAEPAAQMAAAKLWAIMVNNCSELFLDQCSSRKFLDTIEDLLTSNRTTPVVRERVLDVLAGTTYASLSRKHDGRRHEKDLFQSLWKKVKAPNQSDKGIPFDTEDAMFNPPTPRRTSVYSDHQQMTLQPLRSPPLINDATRPPAHRHKTSRNRVIPVEEDIRRLFQECKVGRGNAALLSEALMYAKPQDLSKDIIREFFMKCQASQDFISMQIPWATAGADRSREEKAIQLSMQLDSPHSPTELTIEEQLLAELLRSNEELLDVLRQYQDLERIGIEREAEERSRKETRMDRTQIRYRDHEGNVYLEPPTVHVGGGSSSRSSTPPTPGSSPAASISVHSAPSAHHGHPLPPIPGGVPGAHPLPNGSPNRPILGVPTSLQPGGLAPQQALPSQPTHRFGPRSPAVSSMRSRTPSPEPSRTMVIPPGQQGSPQAMRRLDARRPSGASLLETEYNEADTMTPTFVKPSAKALGKQRAPPAPDREERFDPDDLFNDHTPDGEREGEDYPKSSDSDEELLNGSTRPAINYAYDAVAERHKQRIKEGKLALLADMATPPKVNAVR